MSVKDRLRKLEDVAARETRHKNTVRIISHSARDFSRQKAELTGLGTITADTLVIDRRIVAPSHSPRPSETIQ